LHLSTACGWTDRSGSQSSFPLYHPGHPRGLTSRSLGSHFLGPGKDPLAGLTFSHRRKKGYRQQRMRAAAEAAGGHSTDGKAAEAQALTEGTRNRARRLFISKGFCNKHCEWAPGSCSILLLQGKQSFYAPALCLSLAED